MSFPSVNMKAPHVDAELRDLFEKKLHTLEKFIGEETDVKCEAELRKITAHNNGKIHQAKVNLWLHGRMYRAQATENSFEMAIDEVRNELDKELRRANDKRGNLMKRGGRKIKEMLRFGG